MKGSTGYISIWPICWSSEYFRKVFVEYIFRYLRPELNLNYIIPCNGRKWCFWSGKFCLHISNVMLYSDIRCHIKIKLMRHFYHAVLVKPKYFNYLWNYMIAEGSSRIFRFTVWIKKEIYFRITCCFY